jgi:hypothetical protein
MESATVGVLNVGIIGLGRRWHADYWPALLRERRRFHVKAVCDQSRLRTVEVARQLGCEAAEGPTDLMETADLDALLFVDAQWYGLWPLEAACRMQLPVFCVPSFETDPEHAHALSQRIEEVALPIQFAFAASAAPAARRLQRLLENRFGPAHRVLLRLQVPTPTAIGEWLDFCGSLFDGPSSAAPVSAAVGSGMELIHLRFAGKHDLVVLIEPADLERQRAEVVTEQGRLFVSWPAQVRYRYKQALVCEDLTGRLSTERRLLRQFHQLVLEGAPASGGIAEARRAFALACLARQAQMEGCSPA